MGLPIMVISPAVYASNTLKSYIKEAVSNKRDGLFYDFLAMDDLPL
jgi:hypothetical protein